MIITVDEKLRSICIEIKKTGKTLQEWIDTECSDEFYDLPYAGGFEAIEKAFCFSYFSKSGNEYIFQISLNDIERILSGELKEIKTNNEVNIFSTDCQS
jgi:hypothetical protein